MNQTLAQFGSLLNGAGLLWGVGASAMLHQYGLVESPNDIDVIVAEKDIEKADAIFSSLGKRQAKQHSNEYATGHFLEYNLPLMDVDLIADYRIILPDKSIFSYSFDQESIPTKININGVEIPFTTPEDWYVLYQIMPNREVKIRIVEDYLKENGIANPSLLHRIILQKEVPQHVVERTQSLLNLF